MRVSNYVASTPLYYAIINYQVGLMRGNDIPPYLEFLGSMILASNPQMMGAATGKFLLHRSFGVDVRVQDRIAQSLEKLEDRKEADRLLEEGLKAYQVWMYLVQEGAKQNVFNLSQKFYRASNGTKFHINAPRMMEAAYQY